MPKNIIRKLAMQGKMQVAVDALVELSEKLGDRYVQSSAFGLSGRFYGLKAQKDQGTISNDFYTSQSNSIRAALNSILEDVPDMADDKYDLQALRNVSPAAMPAAPVSPPPNDRDSDMIRILIFTANTAGEAQLDLSEEFSRIREMLDEEGLNDRCQIKRIRLVTPEVIMEEILEYKPHVVHFSGHGVRQRDNGANGGQRRGFGEEAEAEEAATGDEGIETSNNGALVVHNGSNYGSFQIGADFLGGVFEIAMEDELPTHTVVFNACHSEAVSGGVAAYIDNVIATNNEIGDKAAIGFSSTFYQRLVANHTTPKKAFRAARVVTLAYGEPKDRFVFYENGIKLKA
jgi:hypothetical protein